MQRVVRININYDREMDAYWHLVDETPSSGGFTLCGERCESDNLAAYWIESEVKKVKRGGVNCPLCLAKINYIKGIKL